MNLKTLVSVALPAVVIAGLAAPASAGPVTVGSQIRLYDGPGGNGGGEFNADVSPFGLPYEFITFCLQRNEYFTPGATMWVGGVTNQAVSGNDPISAQTAYLYTAFSNQTLANYAFTGTVSFGGQTYDRVASGTALQMAFWLLENEVTRDVSGVFHDVYSSATFGTNPLADFYVAAANAAGWNDIGDVRVLNLFGSYNPLTGFSGPLQDQLFLLPTPQLTAIPTPEPTSLALLGIGLSAVALRLRRSRNS